MAAQVHGFQTEVTKLLDLLANSLYSNKEVFLRELISNASDAIDKLHFLSLTNADLIKDDPNFKIRIKADKESNTLTISDNGLGMTLDEANENLGTIAKSGTKAFVEKLSGDAAKDSQLIGQFGVGFYSAFIVADRVTVLSRSANATENEGVRWESTGNGTYESEQITRKERGTSVILHLKDSEKEFLDNWTLRQAITKYSDHISTPVELFEEKYDESAATEENKDSEKKEKVFEYVQVNDAKALWTRNAKDIKEDEYNSFYKHLARDFQDPLTYSHNKVEGELEYTSLLYIPKKAPWDLYNRDNKHGISLYVQRVFIMDKAEQFLPGYLRFVKGLVDTNALPLNVSREILQDSQVTRKLKKALTKRALNMINKISNDEEQYKNFIAEFGDVLKEGVMEDGDNKNTILKLLRFASTHENKKEPTVSLDAYISRMVDKQKHIYYVIADTYEAAASSPYLEVLKRKGIEVLLLSSRIDEWVMSEVTEYEGKEFIAATSSDLKLGELEGEEDASKQEKLVEDNKDLVERFKKALGDKISEVRVSSRLVESPSCVISHAGNRRYTAQMKKLFESAGQKLPEEMYDLELNPTHPLVQKAYSEVDESIFAQYANIIFTQALLSEQGGLKNPSEFIKTINTLLVKGN